MFRQMKFGWHVLAIGGNRKAARHGGIPVKATIFAAYVLSGLIVGVAGFLYAARQNSVGSDTGIGMEFFALTALVVGLGGFVPGRGAVRPVMVGFATLYILDNALINAGLRGDFVQFAMGAIILMTILAVDVKFRKNRHRLLASTYLDPVAFSVDEAKGVEGLMPGEAPAKLKSAEILAAGESRWTGGRAARRRWRPLLRNTRRLSRQARRARPQTEVDCREDRRTPARTRARRAGPHCRLRSRHGSCQGRQERRGRVAHRPDKPKPVQRPGRHDDPHGRRSRHRSGRRHLFQRRDQALRHRELGARPARRPTERTPAELRSEDAQDAHGLRPSRISQRRLSDARRRTSPGREHVDLARC